MDCRLVIGGRYASVYILSKHSLKIINKIVFKYLRKKKFFIVEFFIRIKPGAFRFLS